MSEYKIKLLNDDVIHLRNEINKLTKQVSILLSITKISIEGYELQNDEKYFLECYSCGLYFNRLDLRYLKISTYNDQLFCLSCYDRYKHCFYCKKLKKIECMKEINDHFLCLSCQKQNN